MIERIVRPDSAAEAEFRQILLRTMALMIAADRVIDPDEIKVVARVYGRLLGERVWGDTVLDEIRAAQADGTQLIELLKMYAPSLSVHDKDFLMHAAFAVCAADEYLSVDEKQDLENMALALGLETRRWEELRAQFNEEDL